LPRDTPPRSASSSTDRAKTRTDRPTAIRANAPRASSRRIVVGETINRRDASAIVTAIGGASTLLCCIRQPNAGAALLRPA
jgi:hypothetical protein